MEFKHIYISLKNNEIYIKNEKGYIYTSYPINNFNKNKNLWQIFLNDLHELSKDYIIHYEYKEMNKEGKNERI